MLKKFHFFYFCYFNHWYKDGKRQIVAIGLEPQDRPLWVLVIFPWILLCDIRLLIIWILHLKPNILFNGFAEIGLLIFFRWAYYQYFIKTGRFRAIYMQYKSTNYRIQDKVFSQILTVLILTLLLSATAFFLFLVFFLKS